jgi:hypothetical protein
MGSRQEEAFYAPHDLLVEIQNFIADHEQLFSTQSYAEVGVVFSPESNFELIARQAAFSDNLRNETVAGLEIAFWEVTARLSREAQPYDVLFFPDDKLRSDHINLQQIQQYRTLILPQCSYLTPNQAAALLGYLDGGGKLIAIEPLAANLPQETRQAIVNHSGTTIFRSTGEALERGIALDHQVQLNQSADLGLHVQRLADGTAAVHIVNYNYDAARDSVVPVDGVELKIRLPQRFTKGTVVVPGAEVQTIEVQTDGNTHRVSLDQLSAYTIALFYNEPSLQLN